MNKQVWTGSTRRVSGFQQGPACPPGKTGWCGWHLVCSGAQAMAPLASTGARLHRALAIVGASLGALLALPPGSQAQVPESTGVSAIFGIELGAPLGRLG